MKSLDKFRGCLLGGAAGDALGYAVEFLQDKDIFAKYGENGITEYSLRNGVADISDDTQMTLFTANGLLLGDTRGCMRGIAGSPTSYIYQCYGDWLKTQLSGASINKDCRYSWLLNVPELHNDRAPGMTCLSALESGVCGTIENPINNSKGCGGVMRVAPIGLFFDYSADRIGAEAASITHGHELGYMPAAALVHIINTVAYNPETTLLEAVESSIQALSEEFSQAKYLHYLLELMQKAIDLSQKNLDDLEAIRELGEGWVAEETLAIAIYCSLKYQDNFDKALIAAVNHSGDSDSTGAVTGNILGAYLGLEKIPQKYLANLELKDVITEIADDLYNGCKMSEYGDYCDEVWTEKYINCGYTKSRGEHND